MAWKKLKLLGVGSYGSVYLAAQVNNSLLMGSPVAVKSAVVDDFSSTDFGSKVNQLRLSSLRNESHLLQELRGCEYVVQSLGADVSSEQGRNIYNLVMEYASGGTFDKMIKEYNGSMAEFQIATHTYMLLKGLSNIHEKDIAHCDFKPANILIFPIQDRSGISILKIADFGSSKKVSEPDLGKSRCTLPYASPESLLHGLNGKAGDIWALGCIVVEMMTGRGLWTSNLEGDLAHQIAYENPKIPEYISEDGKDFLRRCLERDQNKRWTADMLLNHPFIVKNTILSSAARQQIIFSRIQTPWVCSRGMFSTPMKIQFDAVYKQDQLFPEQGCGLPFHLPPPVALGRIC